MREEKDTDCSIERMGRVGRHILFVPATRVNKELRPW